MSVARKGYVGRLTATILGLTAAGAMMLLAPEGSGAQPLRGLLDPSFGHAGRAFSQLGSSFAASEFTSIARQPDGKLVLTGAVEGGRFEQEYVGIVERRDLTGKLDPGFGEGGVVAVRTVGIVAGISGLALQDDGAILFGDSRDNCDASGTAHRLLADGSPDPSFGVGGVSATVPLTVDRIVVDSAGRILVAGSVHDYHCVKEGSTPVLAVARLLPSGVLDSGFGEGGVVRFDKHGLTDASAVGLGVREDGVILVAGSGRSPLFIGRAPSLGLSEDLIALTPSGDLDSGFGEGGVVHSPNPLQALLVLASGETVVAGTTAGLCCSRAGEFVLRRYDVDGELDSGFGEGGVVRLSVEDVNEAAGLAIGPGERILLAGATADASSCEVANCPFTPVLARLTPSGDLDESFGQGGWTAFDLSGQSAWSHIGGLAVSESGDAFAAGSAGRSSDAFAIAALAGGERDPSFGKSGVVREVRLQPSSSEGTGLAVGRGGRVLASAWSDVGVHDGQPVLLGFEADGDPSSGSSDSGFSSLEGPGIVRAGDMTRWAYVLHPGFGRERSYVARFDFLGRLDRGYGSGGAAWLPAGFTAFDLRARRGGGVLAVGRAARRRGMAAFQLNQRGTPKRSFGHDGLIVVGFGGKAGTVAETAAIDRRGRIVLTGRAGLRAGAVRLLANGDLDRRFGNRGRWEWAPDYAVGRTAVALMAGGGILFATSPSAGRDGDVALRRLGRDGDRDRSFGRGGVLHVRRGGTPLLSIFGGRRQIVVATARGRWGETGVVLRAYRTNGIVDRSFGHGGVLRAATSREHAFRPAMAVRQSNGRIVIAGTAGKLEEVGSRVELLRFR